MDTLVQDVRYAFRSLVSRPTVFIVAALSLAIGISANTVVFAALDAYLVRPLPYGDANRLAQVYTANPKRGWTRAGTSVPDFLDWRKETKTLELAAYSGGNVNLVSGDRPERVSGVRVTPSFFRVMGVRPSAGRVFLEEEGEAGRDNAVVLSDAFWRRRFAGDQAVIGQTLLLDGKAYSVVGIMPADFAFPRASVDIWTPLPTLATESRAARYLALVGRLKPGATLESASTELKSITARLALQYPEDEGITARLIRLDREIYNETFRLGATISAVAVALVLLIACSNVANILLARASGRARELALRTALGAARGRLVRQLLTESILLALIGGTLGAILSVWGVKAFVAIIPPDFARTNTIALDGRALLFTLGLAVFSGVLFGTLPAVRATSSNVNAALREGGRSGTMGARSNRLGGSLVVAEISLAMALLVSAGLLIKASVRLQLVDLGFEPRGVLTMAVSIPEAQYPDTAKFVALQSELLRQLRALPGVQAAGAVTALPLEGGSGTSYTIDGEARPEPGKEPIAQFRGTTPGYLDAMKIGMVRGRDFNEQDRLESPKVVLVNESFAKRHWPTGDPAANAIGKRLVLGTGASQVIREIVGVVRDTREFGPDDEAPASMFLPALQRGYRSLSIAMRTSGDAGALAPAARAALRAVDPSLPGYRVRTMEEVVTISMLPDKIMPRLLGVFGAAALVLAIIGVYGVMSYSVSQRTREVGVRMALGAQRRDIMRLVVGQGAALAGLGVVLGLALAALSTKGLGTFLLGVSAYDPMIFGGVTLALATAAVVASYLPARRAVRVDPLVALRAE
jgi:predicted permease